jgi:hypothetical protein
VAFAAVTVKVDELPAEIEVGFAMMLTVGVPAGRTVTVALAEAFPPVPIATAVYVVVAAGLTLCVPPVGCKLYVLPSVPVTVTWVAFPAVTTKVDLLPEGIEVGFAIMLTVGVLGGTTVTVALADAFPPVPVATAV